MPASGSFGTATYRRASVMMPGQIKFPVGIFSRAPELVGAYQDSEAGSGRHAPIPRLSRLNDHLPTSRSIGESLADYAADRAISALSIINAELDPVTIPEIEFGKVAVQMLLADVLI